MKVLVGPDVSIIKENADLGNVKFKFYHTGLSLLVNCIFNHNTSTISANCDSEHTICGDLQIIYLFLTV